MSAVVELYGREGCCLCDEARERLEQLAAEHGFRIVELDIERDERLLRAYLERIPVLLVDGEEVCDLGLDEDRLLERLGAGNG